MTGPEVMLGACGFGFLILFIIIMSAIVGSGRISKYEDKHDGKFYKD